MIWFCILLLTVKVVLGYNVKPVVPTNYSTEFIKKYNHHRKLLEEKLVGNEHEHHKHHKLLENEKTWESLAEVDGLKNEEVVVFITSSNAMHEKLLWER
jgi:hypothetical protein